METLSATTRKVRLGHSTLHISRLALGTAAIGNLYTPVNDGAAHLAVDAAWEAGIRSFDTAPHFGLGLAERRLGEALHHRPRSQFTVATEVGRILEPVPYPLGSDRDNGFAVPATHRRRWDFSADGIRRSLAESLERLRLDRIDIVYLHDPGDHEKQALSEAYPALARLRAEGVVSAIGVTVRQTEKLSRFVRDTDIDVVLLAGRYTLLDQSSLAGLLPLAAKRGISVVIGGVFNSGLLADPKPGAAYDYVRAPDDLLNRAVRMQLVCQRHGVPLRAAALRFALAHPAVAGVLIGARSAQEVWDCMAMAELAIPAEVWRGMRDACLLPDHVPVPMPSRVPIRH